MTEWWWLSLLVYTTPIFGLVLRERGQHEKRKGVGLRVIQLLAVALVVPLATVLCAAGNFQSAVTAFPPRTDHPASRNGVSGQPVGTGSRSCRRTGRRGSRR